MKKILLKILILLSTCYALLMMLHWPIGFTFFTQLSNLFVAVVAGLQLYTELCKKNAFSEQWNTRLNILKYMSVVSIFVTFLVFLCMIAPIMPGGILGAYSQDHYSSLFLHLITPALTLIDFFRNDSDFDWDRISPLYGVIPPFVYLIFIIILGQCGIRWGNEQMMAPYLFLNYGAPAGWFGFMPETMDFTTLGIGVFYVVLLLLLITLFISALFLAAIKHIRRKGEQDPAHSIFE